MENSALEKLNIIKEYDHAFRAFFKPLFKIEDEQELLTSCEEILDNLLFAEMDNCKISKKIENIVIKNNYFFEDSDLEFKKINIIVGKNNVGKSLFFNYLLGRVYQYEHIEQVTEFEINGVDTKNFIDFTFKKFLKNKKKVAAGHNYNLLGDQIGFNRIENLYFTYIPSIRISPRWTYPSSEHEASNSLFKVGVDGKFDEWSKIDEAPNSIIFIIRFITSLIRICTSTLLKPIIKPKLYLDIFEDNDLKDIIKNPEGHFGEKGSGKSNTNMIHFYLTLAKIRKNVILFDEPELFLHPNLQGESISKIAKLDNQLITATHSPFIIKELLEKDDVAIFVFKKNTKGKTEIKDINNGNIKIFKEITLGTINWFAYNLPTVEFHNELYGFLQARAIGECKKNSQEKYFDNWLTKELNVKQDKIWIKYYKENKTTHKRTLQTYIRNYIHHPENDKNKTKYTNEELEKSIQTMVIRAQKYNTTF